MQSVSKKIRQIILQAIGHLLSVAIGWLNNAPALRKLGIFLGSSLSRTGLLNRYKVFFQKMLDTNVSHAGAIRYFDFYYAYQKHLIYQTKHTTPINPVFIVGCMRSGTTIFADTLDLHPDICWIEGELYDVWQYLAGAPCGINGQDCKRLTASDVTPEASMNMHAYFRFALSQKTSNHQASALNKNPHLMNKISYVERIFPNAKFIFIIRSIHPLSYSTWRMLVNQHYGLRTLHACWPAEDAGNCWKFIPDFNIRERDKNRIVPGFNGQVDANFKLIPEAWIKLNYWALRDFESLDPDKRLIIVYENLIKDPKVVLQSVFDFLGFADNEKVIAQAVDHISQSRISFPSKNPLEEWKRSLSDAHKTAIVSSVEKYHSEFQFIADRIANEADISINSDYSW